MEFTVPQRILLPQAIHRCPCCTPLSYRLPLRCPAQIGQIRSLIVFHNIDLATARPSFRDPHRPKSRPHSLHGQEPPPAFESAVKPGKLFFRRQGSRRILRLLAIEMPAFTLLFVSGVIDFFLPSMTRFPPLQKAFFAWYHWGSSFRTKPSS